MSGSYKEVVPKWFAVSLLCFVAAMFLAYDSSIGGVDSPEKVVVPLFFASVVCFGIGTIFHLASRPSGNSSRRQNSSMMGILGWLSGIASIITILAAIRGCETGGKPKRAIMFEETVLLHNRSIPVY